MTSTLTPFTSRRRRPAVRATAWFATLALAAGAAVAAPQDRADGAITYTSTSMQAWGNNDHGQTQLPLDLRSGLKVVSKISLGNHHGVAATADKKLYAWGDDTNGEGSVPDPLKGLGTIDVAAGDGFNVVVGDDHDVRVWGSTPHGLDSVPQAAVDADIVEVAAGYDHALALSSAGKIYPWGNPAQGATIPPLAVLTGTFKEIGAGDGFSVALSSTGKVHAWGSNAYGQATVPAALKDKVVTQIAVGRRHALALTEDNEIVAWGSNAEGALNVPALAPNDRWGQIAAGNGFSAGVAKDSPTAGVWGSGATGVRTPPAPSGSAPVSVVAGGDFLVQGFRRLGVAQAPGVTTVGGAFRVGTPIQGTHARFGPQDDVVTKTPQWLKVTHGVVTSVGDQLTYTPRLADLGSTLVLRTNGANGLYGTAFADTQQIEVKGALFTSMATPTITGDAFVGSTLTGHLSSTPAADSYRYDWYADGVYRQTSDTRGEYVVRADDEGKRITLRGYADKTGYERIDGGASEPTAVVTTAPEFVVQSPPVVTGAPRVGTLLRATAPQATPIPSGTAYRWYRGEQPIEGATGTSYRATTADHGKTVTVVARLTGPGRSETRAQSAPVTIGKAVAKVGWTAKQGSRSGSRRKVTIKVSVSASGVSSSALGGTVKIRDGSSVVTTLRLRSGRGTATVKLKRGKRTIRVSYYGTTGIGAASRTMRLTVR